MLIISKQILSLFINYFGLINKKEIYTSIKENYYVSSKLDIDLWSVKYIYKGNVCNLRIFKIINVLIFIQIF